MTTITPITPRSHAGRRVVALAEVAIAAVLVVLDVIVPTFLLIALAGASLLLRRDGPGSLGLRRVEGVRRLVSGVTVLVVAWTLLQFGLIMPLLSHLTGERQDVSQFEDLQGDLGALALFLALTWTVAAFGEEIAYRGYVLTRGREAFGTGPVALITAVAVSSLLFGLAHTEQGMIGVVVTTIDAAFFCLLRFRYRTLWAAILGHGLSNTIGLVTFYLVGPVYGLW